MSELTEETVRKQVECFFKEGIEVWVSYMTTELLFSESRTVTAHRKGIIKGFDRFCFYFDVAGEIHTIHYGSVVGKIKDADFTKMGNLLGSEYGC